MRIRRRVWSAGAALAAAVADRRGLPAGVAQAAATVSGGGSTFAAPEMQQFATDTSGAPYNLQVNYAATGSGAGPGELRPGHLPVRHFGHRLHAPTMGRWREPPPPSTPTGMSP